MSVQEIKRSIVEKLERNFGCEVEDATTQQLYYVLAQTVRDEVMQRRTAARGERKRQQAKKVYYLSAEFLVGRALHNNMVNVVNEEAYMQAMDELGLDRVDRSILTTMMKKFDGRPVGLDPLAATTGEDAVTIEDVYEPYLMQLGFIMRTPRGRVCTQAAYDHMKIAMPAEAKQEGRADGQLSLLD